MIKILKEKIRELVLLLLFIILVLVIAIICLTVKIDKCETNTNIVRSNILITAGHLDTIEGYILLHKDDDLDLAYYIKDNSSYSKLDVQDVKIEGLKECKIISSDNGTFEVSTNTPDKIVNGMSGRRVYSKQGEELGFIQGLEGSGILKCRTSE